MGRRDRTKSANSDANGVRDLITCSSFRFTILDTRARVRDDPLVPACMQRVSWK